VSSRSQDINQSRTRLHVRPVHTGHHAPATTTSFNITIYGVIGTKCKHFVCFFLHCRPTWGYGPL